MWTVRFTMKQYCRYCTNAIDYNGEATEFVCTAKAECGNNGAGRFYPAEKAKRIKNEDTLNGLAGAVGILFDLPSVKQEPKTGHREYNDIYDHYLCENCKTIVMDYDNFCPNCGVKMVEEQESEEV